MRSRVTNREPPLFFFPKSDTTLRMFGNPVPHFERKVYDDDDDGNDDRVCGERGRLRHPTTFVLRILRGTRDGHPARVYGATLGVAVGRRTRRGLF